MGLITFCRPRSGRAKRGEPRAGKRLVVAEEGLPDGLPPGQEGEHDDARPPGLEVEPLGAQVEVERMAVLFDEVPEPPGAPAMG